MAIKKALGRLDFPSNLVAVLKQESIGVLNIGIEHSLSIAELPVLHLDPFDRMQIVQSNLEGLTLITRDRRIQQYDVRWLGG